MTETDEPTRKLEPDDAPEEETYVVENRQHGRKVTRQERDEIVAERINEGWTLTRMAVVEGDPEKSQRKAEILAFEKPEPPARDRRDKR
jgi:hypothetical protein